MLLITSKDGPANPSKQYHTIQKKASRFSLENDQDVERIDHNSLEQINDAYKASNKIYLAGRKER